jgi:hypothetical protein
MNMSGAPFGRVFARASSQYLALSLPTGTSSKHPATANAAMLKAAHSHVLDRNSRFHTDTTHPRSQLPSIQAKPPVPPGKTSNACKNALAPWIGLSPSITQDTRAS